MFDVTSRITYKNVPNWHRDVVRVVGRDLPAVLCGNKCHSRDRKVKVKHMTFYRKKNVEYFDISVPDMRGQGMLYNIDKPFLSLARKIAGRPDLIFLEG